ncbi:MAG: hypothetical protein ABL921_25910, partial [Pirellula sp.]
MKQTYQLQLRIKGVLAAIRNHGRRTWTFESPQHVRIRQGLLKTVTAKFDGMPLNRVIEDLSRRGGLDIRFDQLKCESAGQSLRTPINISIKDRSLQSILNLILKPRNLMTSIRDGVIWIVPMGDDEDDFVSAVMDVKDLCRNESESASLRETIESQTGDVWQSQGGSCSIRFAKNGTMVVFGPESVIDQVEQLIERYRQVLRVSKPRGSRVDTKIETHYYVVQNDLADTAIVVLPKMIEPDSWQNESNPKAPGKISRYATEPRAVDFAGDMLQRNVNRNNSSAKGNEKKQVEIGLVVERSVLI